MFVVVVVDVAAAIPYKIAAVVVVAPSSSLLFSPYILLFRCIIIRSSVLSLSIYCYNAVAAELY